MASCTARSGMRAASGRNAPSASSTGSCSGATSTRPCVPFTSDASSGVQRSSDWIAQATLRVMQWHDPALTLCYLPHLDYVLQREGPGGAGVRQELRELDRVLTWLVQACERRGARVIVCGDYGIEPATRVAHPNRALREAGLLRTREEFGGQALDLNASAAFAMCDHQIAHVYAPHAASLHAARECLAALLAAEDSEGEIAVPGDWREQQRGFERDGANAEHALESISGDTVQSGRSAREGER